MKLKSIAKNFFYAVVFIVAIFGLYSFEKNLTPKHSLQNHLPLRNIQFSSDGTVTTHWLAKALAIKKNILLSDIDIFALKKRLLEFSQIRDVCIEKQFPDALSIQMSERHPLLKFAIKNNGREELLFVDSKDGSIFRAACMPKSLILATPYANLKVEKSPQSPLRMKKIEGIKAVEHLVNALHSEYPEIYEQIKKFSLKKYDHRSSAPWSRIEVFLKNGLIIAFGSQDIDLQLLHLDYLMHQRNLASMNVKKIDLAKINSAIIENR
ncbi:MAG: FtsQ-type POTRA domain-containing protein [Puniceicoccales bacterium]|jgi:cell division septal protein FtsQ|nr:FtsQ-type POTRA domain-containing protein [Puniceicoccales bacterium]